MAPPPNDEVSETVNKPWNPMKGIMSGPVDGPERVQAAYPDVEAVVGLKVEHRASRFGGAVLRMEHDGVVIRGRSGMDRVFKLIPGAFSVDRKPVNLVRPRPKAPAAPARTASGSVAVAGTRARTARTSRILVEGVHDAELVEKVWGDDLRIEGVVVERLDGADDLAAVVSSLRPGPGRRLGILVDHLVPGTKEARLAAEVRHPHVLVTGTPYVDVWQAIKPATLGIPAWPQIPKGRPWKEGVCDALGFEGPTGAVWKRLLAQVSTYADLEPSLVGAVESLIDFVTELPEG